MKKIKNIIALLLLYIIIFSGCKYDGEEPPPCNEDSLKVLIKNFALDGSTEFTISQLYDYGIFTWKKNETDTDEAKDYILQFCTKYGSGTGITENGWFEITRDSLWYFETALNQPVVDSNEHIGLMLYMCLNKKYFAAYRVNKALDQNLDPFKIRNTSLRFNLSTCSGHFSPAQMVDTRSISEALRTYNYVCTEGVTDTGYTYVNKWANDFLIHILGADPAWPGVLEDPVGFFHHNQIYKVITQNDGATGADTLKKCKGLRIYWAFHDIERNKIKMVVFGIDKNGYNIWRKYDDTKAYMLEASWPPY